MARQNRTFSSADIIRFYQENLTKREQRAVNAFFGVKEEDFLDFFPKFLKVVEKVPGPVGRAAKILGESLGVLKKILKGLGVG